MKQEESLGKILKRLRDKEGLPLRKVAAEIDIDPSTLGKFELDKRIPSRHLLLKLSNFYKIDSGKLIVESLSDKISGELEDEILKFEILRATADKLKLNKHKRA